jgi:hypothetical protein
MTHSHTLSLRGDGDADNSSFEIVNNELQTKEVFDYEAKTRILSKNSFD